LSPWLSLDPISKTIQKHLDVRNIIEFDSLPLERPFIKMDMGVDEPRYNQTSVQIEFVCFSAGKVQDLVGAPHGQDPSTADGKGLRHGLLGVLGGDVSVE
jgi:hypothetical protein